MYIPAAFAETDLARLHEHIERHSFGLLVTQLDDALFATHLPFLLDRSIGPRGGLIGHLARANPQWRQADGQTALAIFSGPHAYISPTWYEAEHVVPTWNYVAVHVRGRIRVISDEDILRDIVRDTVREYERAMPHPWSFDESDAYIDKLLTRIVGFHVEIESIVGKWKLNQNHSVDRRRKVIAALEQRGGESPQAIAALMNATLAHES